MHTLTPTHPPVQYILCSDRSLYFSFILGGTSCKEPACQGRIHRDKGSIPGSGKSPGEGNGNPLEYSCLGNPMHRGAWQATVHGVGKSQTWLKWLSMHTHFPFMVLITPCNHIPLYNYFIYFLAALRGLWDLSSPTRYWTKTTTVKVLSPSHWGSSLHLCLISWWIRSSMRAGPMLALR